MGLIALLGGQIAIERSHLRRRAGDDQFTSAGDADQRAGSNELVIGEHHTRLNVVRDSRRYGHIGEIHRTGPDLEGGDARGDRALGREHNAIVRIRPVACRSFKDEGQRFTGAHPIGFHRESARVVADDLIINLDD